MNCENFAVGMANESTSQRIRLFAGSIGSQVCRTQIQWFSYTNVTNLAAIDDVVGIDADLMTKYRIIELRDFGFETFNRSRPKTDEMVLQIIIPLFRQLSGYL